MSADDQGAPRRMWTIPFTFEQLPAGAQNKDWFDINSFDINSFDSSPNKEVKAKRKAEGRCEECGELLPMSVHGLGECPQHPTPLPPDFKQ